MSVPEWLRDVEPMTDAEFEAFERRMSEKQHEEERMAAEIMAETKAAS